MVLRSLLFWDNVILDFKLWSYGLGSLDLGEDRLVVLVIFRPNRVGQRTQLEGNRSMRLLFLALLRTKLLPDKAVQTQLLLGLAMLCPLYQPDY